MENQAHYSLSSDAKWMCQNDWTESISIFKVSQHFQNVFVITLEINFEGSGFFMGKINLLLEKNF